MLLCLWTPTNIPNVLTSVSYVREGEEGGGRVSRSPGYRKKVQFSRLNCVCLFWWIQWTSVGICAKWNESVFKVRYFELMKWIENISWINESENQRVLYSFVTSSVCVRKYRQNRIILRHTLCVCEMSMPSILSYINTKKSDIGIYSSCCNTDMITAHHPRRSLCDRRESLLCFGNNRTSYTLTHTQICTVRCQTQMLLSFFSKPTFAPFNRPSVCTSYTCSTYGST